MITLIKILIILAVLFLFAYPLISAKGKLKKFFPASALRYESPHNRKNFFFLLLTLAEFIVVALVFYLLDSVASLVSGISFVESLFAKIGSIFSSQWDFIFFTVRLVVINLILLYGFVIVKAFLKKTILDRIFGLKEKKETKKKKDEKKDGETDGKEEKKEDTPAETEEETKASDRKKDKNRRIPYFVHSDADEDAPDEGDAADGDPENTDGDPAKNGENGSTPENGEKKDGEAESDEDRYGPVAAFIYSIFFEGQDFEIARPWVIRVRTILQCFIYLVEALYALFLLLVLVSTFFPLPDSLYFFLIDVFRIGDWYIFPILSILFLQELCNLFRTPSAPFQKDEDRRERLEKKKEKSIRARLRKLLVVLKKHFDEEHSLRYYPEAVQEEIKEYKPKNITYRSALNYIGKQMQDYSGRVVQSYLQCLDASFSDHHVYFASSFYSELGAYLVSYTYIRLLSGARVIFVVSDPEERDTLRSFLSERLIRLTGTSPTNSWRLHMAEERLDQADVLIACPEDFRDNNIIAQYPAFFEEVSNAIFLDADRMISLDSYLCPLMATRLKKATGDRIRFIFLTQDLYKGFAARSLPKFFCAEPILAFSSAKENESVSYVLWNKESKSHRIYNENGQKTTCLEYMIADLACAHDVDGVRILSESDIDHAERKILLNAGVEINKFYRDLVDVNYMIYSDDRCNLSASIYACTRFRGQKSSVVHILSKPYLLREYFISKVVTENFVNRSSFIQPRVPEHIDSHKLSLLRIFCDVASEAGLPVGEFERRIREVISVGIECGDIIASAFCRRMLAEKKDPDAFSTAELAAYLIAGLCDTDLGENADSDAAVEKSAGKRAKEFYLIFDPATHDGYSTHREKYIVFNREREVFNKLFACNDRVALCLNDTIIGYEDTFPIRTHLEYVAGQSILFHNSEYEIEHISDDGRTIYLRSENVKLSHCLDTVHLRRYRLNSLTPQPKRTGVLHNTKLDLEEIRVTECKASFRGETYGFYGLSSDKQTLDFYHKDGVDGNPHIENPHQRNVSDGRILKVELLTRMECTDGMRMLLSAVFNEFIKTIFPKTYRAIAIVPVLAEPLPFSAENEPSSEADRIRALYPYLENPTEEFRESDPNRITLLFINDCYEDVGAFQWFYDLSGRYMQEFLANIYSYLHWLQQRPDKQHYIYFGGESLPECFDLEGCCKLLEGYNRILAELGDKDIETAGNDDANQTEELCSFCHKPMETGRYSLFDQHRYICADCFDVVDDPELLEDLHAEMREYLKKTYPNVNIAVSKAALDPVYSLPEGQELSQYYYRVDQKERTVFTERDNPVQNTKVSLLRGIIELWQADNELVNAYAPAQLYYEELLYLREKGLTVSADWTYNALSDELRAKVEEIAAYTGIPVAPAPAPEEVPGQAEAIPANADEGSADGTPAEDKPADDTPAQDAPSDGTPAEDKPAEDTPEEETPVEPGTRTSFDFLRTKRSATDGDGDGDPFFGEDDEDGLYNPDKMPRFWKRYLRNMKAEDGTEEDVSDAENGEDVTDGTPVDGTPDDGTPADGTPADGTPADKTPEAPVPEKGKKKKKFSFFRSPGDKVCPVEEDEATNPKIRVYNEMVRHAYNYSEEPFDRSGVSDDMLEKIFYYVQGDYPELFWLYGWSWNNQTCSLRFRCKDANDRFDEKQVNRKRKELRKAAKTFTRGISRRTDPYQALLTIYRRLIRITDYDSIGLDAGVDGDKTRDDPLRSLHSALVEHKVVCAGYSIAMLYLLQSVGIVAADVTSESDAEGNCHAFNILKLGKFCYYLDATWGDPSNTKTGDADKDLIHYDYCCVPFDEFTQAPASQVAMHHPRKAFYPNLETFTHSNHEYFRYHNAYLRSYNEEEIIRILADAAKNYNPKEMGRFTVGIRFPTKEDAAAATERLLRGGTVLRLAEQAKETLKKKNQIALLSNPKNITQTHCGVIYVNFDQPEQ